MAGEDVAIIGFLSAVTVGLWVLVPRYWRGKGTRTAYRGYRSFVMLTRPAQRRLYRTAVVDAVAWTLIAAGFGFSLVAEAIADGSPSGTVTVWSLVGSLGGLGLFFVLGSTIMLFNRPKLLIAPHLRGQVGLTTLWRRACRIRRAERRQRRGTRR